MSRLSVSIVVLTHNRKDCVSELLHHLRGLSSRVSNVILVDNGSTDGTGSLVLAEHPDVLYIRSETNLGACGRNLGMEAACEDIIITVDDDIFGLTIADLEAICSIFAANSALGALNFQVTDYFSGNVCNWVHHCSSGRARESFETYEITEGAVAFRESALGQVGYYWEKFFIGHEGPDLAFRLMDAGFKVWYEGQIVVRHKHEARGRLSWRFYYFDTRNQIWLAARRMHFAFATKYLFIGLGSMAFYSLRDGFFLWWWRAIFHGLREFRAVWRTRQAMTKETEDRVREIDKGRPGFWTQARRRFMQPANRLDG